MEEHRCGEGYSTQNSRTLLIGIGEILKLESLVVKWPSGREEVFSYLPVNRLFNMPEENSPRVEKYFAE